MKVVITFKESERWLYNDIVSHSSQSGYVKDILKKNCKGPGEPHQQQLIPAISDFSGIVGDD